MAELYVSLSDIESCHHITRCGCGDCIGICVECEDYGVQYTDIVSCDKLDLEEHDRKVRSEEIDYLLSALANFWGQKNAEEFREWLDSGVAEEFYQ